MATKNMQKMKRLIDSGILPKEDAHIRFETNYYKAFEKEHYKKEMASWPKTSQLVKKKRG